MLGPTLTGVGVGVGVGVVGVTLRGHIKYILEEACKI